MTTTEQPPPSDSSPPDDIVDAPESRLVARPAHSRALRIMHWVNVPVMAIMIYTGIRIYWADLRDPFVLGIGGVEIFTFWPDWVYTSLDIERRLAKGIGWHLVFGWFFVVNGLLYTVHLLRKRRWRRLAPTSTDLRDAPKVLAHDLHLREELPPQGKYNAAQKITYSAVWVMGALLVLSGFAIYKPTQVAPLTWVLGGYESARFIHFTMTVLFLVFVVVHVLQVVRSGWRNFASIITGYRVEETDAVPDDDASRPEAVS
jgi:thiosulfate reductase cytochrome b subunit